MKWNRNTNPSRLNFLVLFGAIWLLSACGTKPALDGLRDEVANTLSGQEGDFAVAFKDLSSGETLFINEKETFHAASTMKVPVMIDVYKQAALGRLSLDDSIEVKNQFKSIVDSSLYHLDKSDDSDTLLYGQVGTKKMLHDLVYDMIIVSSNLATNIIIGLVDGKKVTATMRGLGAPDILVLRGVEDQKAYEAGLNNTTTAYDLMAIFEKLAQGEAVGPDADQQMTDILLDQKFNEIIPARLPANVKVAHKTGNITGVQHDAALVILPNGKKYVLVLLSKNLKDVEAGVAAMANVSEMVYHYVANK